MGARRVTKAKKAAAKKGQLPPWLIKKGTKKGATKKK